MERICKRFGGVVALDDVSFSASPGELVALLGANGAGKSTLMKILGGIHRPDAGVVRLAGNPVSIRSPAEAMRLGIGFIHQELALVENLDVAGNIYLGREPTRGRRLRLVDRRRLYADAGALVERLGLALAPRASLAALSIAQRQLVEIAKALSREVRVLIMDEPTSSLTPVEATRLHEVIGRLRDGGTSIVYISHRLAEVTSLADRVVVLRDGANAGTLLRGEATLERIVGLMLGAGAGGDAPLPHRLDGSLVTGEAAQPLLQVRGLRTRRYPTVEVSLDLARGETLALAGLVGAGRSELVRAIFAVDAPLAGTVTLGGQPLEIRRPRDAVAHGICLVPEDRGRCGLILEMAVRENVTLPSLGRFARLGLLWGAAERDAADRACRSLGTRVPSQEAPVWQLSGGNQQKVALAKWLAMRPRVLLLDEPTRGIDVVAKAEIHAVVRALAARGTAIIVVSSDIDEVLALGDRVAVLREGALTGILVRGAATEDSVMRLAFGSGDATPAGAGAIRHRGPAGTPGAA